MSTIGSDESCNSNGFGRKIINNSNGQAIVVYVAPDGSVLNSVTQVIGYLTTKGTCKCGLSSPISLDDFNFKPSTATNTIKLVIHKSNGTWISSAISPHLKRKRKSKHKSNVKRFRIDPPSDLLPNLPQCNPMLTPNRTDDSAQRVTDQNSGTQNTSDGTKPDLTQPNKEHRPVNKQTSSNNSDQTTSQPIKCLINNETLDSRIVPCANEMKHTESPIDDRIKLDDLENSEIIILDSFDNRESDSDNKSDTRVSTPDSICNERSAIFDQFRERYHQFHFKNFIDQDGPTGHGDGSNGETIKIENTAADIQSFSIPPVIPENGTNDKISKDEDNNEIIASKQQRVKTESELKGVGRPRKRPVEITKCSEFSIGDLVWGRLSGSPAWPGIIVDPACIDNKELVRNNAKKIAQGKLWIMWYGERTFTQMHPSSLKSMEEGLTSPVGTAPRKTSKRLSDRLDKAIEEALLEYSRKENRLKLRKRTK